MDRTRLGRGWFLYPIPLSRIEAPARVSVWEVLARRIAGEIILSGSPKHRAVVFHGTPPNELAVKLAEHDLISLVHSKAQSFDHSIKSLRRLHRVMLRRKLGIPIRLPKGE